jgi:hypothetical protein
LQFLCVDFGATIGNQLVSQAFAGSEMGKDSTGSLNCCSALSGGFAGLGCISHRPMVPLRLTLIDLLDVHAYMILIV